MLKNRKQNPKQKGFTLLEVMVALTIAGMALGGMFSVIAGNKRLAYRSEEALIRSTQVRSQINFSQLNDERGDAFIDFQNDELLLSIGELYDTPERKTRESQMALRGYELLNENGETIAEGSYWVILDFPE